MDAYFSELYQGLEPNPQNNVFEDIWGEYERVVLHSLVTTFGLDFIADQSGGDVDTVRSVEESQSFKNPKYAEKYAQRGKYDSAQYHNDPAYRNITAENRKQFNETGRPIEDTYVPGNKLVFNKGDGPSHRASLDHVISAHEVHDDPVRILSDISGVDLANAPENLRYTNMSLNSKMKDMPVEDFIKMSEENPEKVNWNGNKGEPLPEEVKEELRKADKEARDYKRSTISKSYYTSPQFYTDVVKSATKRGVEMGVRQMLGFIFIEIWYACKEELADMPPGSSLNECIEAIVKGVEKGADNIRKKHKKLLSQFELGFTAGGLANLTTTISNIFIKTEKNVVCYIRQAYAAVVQAGNILFINPNDLLIGEQLRMATLVLGSGASAIVGLYVGDTIAATPIGMMPEVGPLVTRFVSILVGGLLSCTLLILLDRSKLINNIIGKMNQYTTSERKMLQTSREFSRIAAELEGYDIDEFIDECYRFSMVGDIISKAEGPEELDRILEIIYSVFGIENPWNGDFDVFMKDDDAVFDFS